MINKHTLKKEYFKNVALLGVINLRWRLPLPLINITFPLTHKKHTLFSHIYSRNNSKSLQRSKSKTNTTFIIKHIFEKEIFYFRRKKKHCLICNK